MTVAPEAAEEARAALLELFPGGFEESESSGELLLAAYTDGAGELRLRTAFGEVRSEAVAPGWEDRWRTFHRPVRVGGLWIGPPWEQPPRDATAVVIDPGRAFGTGAHPTTRLTLELLLDCHGGSLLDVGSGSGVLAIAAAKLGFVPVVGLDIDEVAVEATRRNAQLNGVAVETYVLDATVVDVPPADIVVANITAEFVEQAAPHVNAPRFIASGYLASQRPTPAGYRPTSRASDDGWAADAFARTGK